jgi:choline dehydrogenase-like flavoprotein
MRPHIPLVLFNKSGRYSLRYHAEQRPDWSSRIARGNSGAQSKLIIDFAFHEDDVRSVVRSHEVLDVALRRSGCGYLHYWDPQHARYDAVRRQARDGYHQIGTTRMGFDPNTSVVDTNCKVHGLANLYIASSSVFPTSLAANPTLPLICLSLRLAGHVTRALKRPLKVREFEEPTLDGALRDVAPSTMRHRGRRAVPASRLGAQ